MTLGNFKDLLSRWTLPSTEVNTPVKRSEYKRLLAIWACRHKVFISYYHQDDQVYRDQFEARYNDLFISKSVRPGDIDSDLSSEYTKRLIREDYITDSSVVVVLVGPRTKLRKHVDWEIYAGLSKKAGGHSGLLGILLPTFPLRTNPLIGGVACRFSDLPDRLADNVRSGYAQVYAWPDTDADDNCVRSALEKAFSRRLTHVDLIQNWREQMPTDRPARRVEELLESLSFQSVPVFERGRLVGPFS